MTGATAISDGRVELAGLLERVRAATGPDRALDALLAEAFDLSACVLPDCHPDLFAKIIARVKRGEGANDPAVEFYTASIDVALAFALRIVPEANCHGYDKGEWGADAYISLNNVASGHWLSDGHAETVPLAFIAAALNRLTSLQD